MDPGSSLGEEEKGSFRSRAQGKGTNPKQEKGHLSFV